LNLRNKFRSFGVERGVVAEARLLPWDARIATLWRSNEKTDSYSDCGGIAGGEFELQLSVFFAEKSL
jgi:hypothetical protein